MTEQIKFFVNLCARTVLRERIPANVPQFFRDALYTLASLTLYPSDSKLTKFMRRAAMLPECTDALVRNSHFYFRLLLGARGANFFRRARPTKLKKIAENAFLNRCTKRLLTLVYRNTRPKSRGNHTSRISRKRSSTFAFMRAVAKFSKRSKLTSNSRGPTWRHRLEPCGSMICYHNEKLNYIALFRHGNTSSSSIWYELEHHIKYSGVKKGDAVWQIAFGSGFKWYVNKIR